MTNDRILLQDLRFLPVYTQDEYVETLEESKFEIEPLRESINEYTQKETKYDAIHALMLLNNKGLKEVLSFKDIKNENLNAFKLNIQKYSCVSTDVNKVKLFKLDEKHLDHFNSFYYNSYQERIESLRIYNEFYKPKSNTYSENSYSKNDPVRLENCVFGRFLGLVRLALSKTSLIEFLVGIVKFHSNLEIVGEETVEFALQCLAVFLTFEPDSDEGKEIREAFSPFEEFLNEI